VRLAISRPFTATIAIDRRSRRARRRARSGQVEGLEGSRRVHRGSPWSGPAGWAARSRAIREAGCLTTQAFARKRQDTGVPFPSQRDW